MLASIGSCKKLSASSSFQYPPYWCSAVSQYKYEWLTGWVLYVRVQQSVGDQAKDAAGSLKENLGDAAGVVKETAGNVKDAVVGAIPTLL